MRRRGLVVAAAWMMGGAWLGCNALLGNESAVFEPDAAVALPGEGGADGPLDEASARDANATDAPIVHPCTNTSLDPFNCGACGHDCLGGACNAGVCAPVVLANDPGEPAEITVDDTHVYWTNEKTGDVRRVAIGGGAVETIYDGAEATPLGEGLVRAGADVYFTLAVDDGGIFKCPSTGCGAAGPTPVVAPMSSPGYLALADGGVLVVAETLFNGRIGRCTLPCTSGVTFVTGPEGFPKFVAVDGESFYWSTLTPPPGELRGKLDDASPPFSVVSTQATQQIAINGAEVLFAARGSGIRAVPRDGGAVRRVYDPNVQSERFAIDGTTIYFNDVQAATGRILRCPIVGCGDAGTTMASLQAKPNAIAVDKTNIYWTNRGDGNEGAIMRLAK